MANTTAQGQGDPGLMGQQTSVLGAGLHPGLMGQQTSVLGAGLPQMTWLTRADAGAGQMRSDSYYGIYFCLCSRQKTCLWVHSGYERN